MVVDKFLIFFKPELNLWIIIIIEVFDDVAHIIRALLQNFGEASLENDSIKQTISTVNMT